MTELIRSDQQSLLPILWRHVLADMMKQVRDPVSRVHAQHNAEVVLIARAQQDQIVVVEGAREEHKLVVLVVDGLEDDLHRFRVVFEERNLGTPDGLQLDTLLEARHEHGLEDGCRFGKHLGADSEALPSERLACSR